MAMPIEKLKKVVDMATKGATPGERANAERIARKACEELGIPYADALKGDYGPQGIPYRDLNDIFWDGVDIPNPFGKGFRSTYTTQNPNWQQRQQQANSDFQDIMEKGKKMMANYKDKYGDVWSGTEVSNLNKMRRYKLFGKDPLI